MDREWENFNANVANATLRRRWPRIMVENRVIWIAAEVLQAKQLMAAEPNGRPLASVGFAGKTSVLIQNLAASTKISGHPRPLVAAATSALKIIIFQSGYRAGGAVDWEKMGNFAV